MMASLKAAASFVAARPLLVVLLISVAALWSRTAERNQLKRWQDQVVQATRDAADHPKLATGAVPLQILNLGVTIERIRIEMAQAKATALAAKQAADTYNETRREDADDALVPTIEAALRGTDAYARAGRMQCSARTAPLDRSDDRRGDLPGTAAPAQVSDRSGAGPALVLIPRSALDTCTTLKVRLDNAHDWAVGGER